MTTTAAYVSTVKDNRIIELPQTIPIGAKIAVVVLPSEKVAEDVIRTMRFQKVMNAIRAAINGNFEAPEISDRELKQFIGEARQAAKA